jgi:hypothetical protein
VAPEPVTLKLIGGPVVFVAGSFSDCRDFQADVMSALVRDHVVLFNRAPRGVRPRNLWLCS